MSSDIDIAFGHEGIARSERFSFKTILQVPGISKDISSWTAPTDYDTKPTSTVQHIPLQMVQWRGSRQSWSTSMAGSCQ